LATHEIYALSLHAALPIFLKRIADVFQVWYLGRRANGDCGARDEWIAAHLTLDVLMWIALPRTETARTWADDPRQNAARVWSTGELESTHLDASEVGRVDG